MVVLYIMDQRFGVFSPKMSPKNQPHVSLSTVWQYWLGMAKLKNVNSKRFQQVVMTFPEFSTNYVVS